MEFIDILMINYIFRLSTIKIVVIFVPLNNEGLWQKRKSLKS